MRECVPLGHAESVAEAQEEADTERDPETVEDMEREPVAVEHRVSEPVALRDCMDREALGEPEVLYVPLALREGEVDAETLAVVANEDG